MTTKFHRYYVGTEPEHGTLVNGQYWRTRFGRGTLQIMWDDGLFADDEPDVSVEEWQSMQIDNSNLEDENVLLNNRITELAEQIKALGAVPVQPVEDSVRGDGEEVESG